MLLAKLYDKSHRWPSCTEYLQSQKTLGEHLLTVVWILAPLTRLFARAGVRHGTARDMTCPLKAMTASCQYITGLGALSLGPIQPSTVTET